MTSPENHAVAPCGTEGKKALGKGIFWNVAELLALSHSAATVCMAPCTGANMSKAEMGRRIRSAFIASDLRPAQACTKKNSGDYDQRRWDVRSADACNKMWARMLQECTKFHAKKKQVLGIQWTGNPMVKYVELCAQVLYSDGSAAVGHLYDVIRNEQYLIRKIFLFMNAYKFLESYTTLIQADSTDGVTNMEEVVHMTIQRPEGTKRTKKEKADEKKKATCAVSA